MRTEDLFEMASPVVYHATYMSNALEILRSNEFRLSMALGKRREVELLPQKEKLFYLSTTRMKGASYTRSISNPVIFELDGSALNHRYTAKAMDYWGGQLRHIRGSAGFEAEDRIYHTKPTIPNAARYIKAIHMAVSNSAGSSSPAMMEQRRKIAFEGRRAGIPVHVYATERELFTMRKEHRIRVNWKEEAASIKGRKIYNDNNFNPFRHWLELFYNDRYDRLSSEAKVLLMYYAHPSPMKQRDGVEMLTNTIRNNKNHPRIESIYKAMQAARTYTVKDFVEYVSAKWEKIREQGQYAY